MTSSPFKKTEALSETSLHLQNLCGFNSDYSYYKQKNTAGIVYQAKLEEQGGEPGTAQIEAVKTARKISDLAQTQLILCLSSGVDSQVMLQAFRAAGVNFKVAILKFKNGLNSHDTEEIIQMCQNLGVRYECVDLDIVHFFESGTFFDYGVRYECQSPQLAAHLWLFDQLDGAPICSGNFVVPLKEDRDIFWVGLPGDLHGCLFRYFSTLSRQGEPWFLQNRSEVCGAFLKQPELSNYVQLKENKIDDEYALRCAAYVSAGFKIAPQLAKQTGFEKVREYYDIKFKTHSGMAFNALFREPLELLNPLATEFVQVLPQSYTSLHPQYMRFKPIVKSIQRYTR